MGGSSCSKYRLIRLMLQWFHNAGPRAVSVLRVSAGVPGLLCLPWMALPCIRSNPVNGGTLFEIPAILLPFHLQNLAAEANGAVTDHCMLSLCFVSPESRARVRHGS